MQTEKQSAKKAGLRYVDCHRPGIHRKRQGNLFVYEMPDGSLVNDPETLARIAALVIPPAWEEVWICPLPAGHLQATGIDQKGRKQYKYHPAWSRLRSETKFGRLPAFAAALPGLRQQVEAHLRGHGMTRNKVLAAVILLMEKAHLRIGNREYARLYQSYGITTLQDRHVDIHGSKLRFEYKGKKGVHHLVELNDRRLARIVGQCRDIPGQELFQYFDEEGKRQDIDSGDVNDYIRQITGDDFSAKDFRTWAGTLLAFEMFSKLPPPDTGSEARKNTVEVVREVAKALGNTPTVCRKYYIHPLLPEMYSDGRLHRFLSASRLRGSAHLSTDERRMIRLLEEYQ